MTRQTPLLGGGSRAPRQPCGSRERLLIPGYTCWRVERARRAAFLVDNAAYFAAAKAALLKARRSVWLLGWQFDPRTRLTPGAPFDEADQIGDLLNELSAKRPGLDVRVLIWNAALGVALGKRMMPQRALAWFRGSPVHFRLDGTVPKGATHHQKLLVIDDALAFCSGDDFSANRWDRPEHRDQEPDRRTPWGSCYPPRHGMTMMVEGETARALGDLARARWHRATGESVAAPPDLDGDPWPEQIPAALADVGVGISRTMPRWRDEPECRENEALYLEAIAAARQLIYIENQYFASSVIGEALERCLGEPKGPRIVVVTGEHAPSFFDRTTMDPQRDALVRRLRAADRYGRFQAYAPHAPEGRPVIVHSKLIIVDDRLLRIGSTNIADRSLGYDTECDLALEADGQLQTATIAELRHRLVAHFLGREAGEVLQEEKAQGSLVAAIERLDRTQGRRLRPLDPAEPSFPHSLAVRYRLGDPRSRATAWRPWRHRNG